VATQLVEASGDGAMIRVVERDGDPRPRRVADVVEDRLQRYHLMRRRDHIQLSGEVMLWKVDARFAGAWLSRGHYVVVRQHQSASVKPTPRDVCGATPDEGPFG
jgi:hypothetical protein